MLWAALVAGWQTTTQPAVPRESAPAQEGTDGDVGSDALDPAAPTPPAIPKPPDGVLPVVELPRLDYAPSERPQVRFVEDTLVVVTTTGAVDGYDASTGEFRFKLGLPGEALFTPVALEGTILAASKSGTLWRLDPQNGTLLEEFSLPFPLVLPPLVSPELGLVFVATPEGDVAALATGGLGSEPVFRVRTPERPAALAVDRDTLVVSGAERTLTALHARTGMPLWDFIGRGGFSPVAFRADGKRLYVGDDLGELYSLNTENGKVDFHWSTGASIRHAPLVDEKRVFVASLGNYVYAYDAGGGSEQWRAPLLGRPGLGPTRVHSQLLVPTLDGILVEINLSNGVLGKSHGLPSELASAPAFRVMTPPEGYFERLEEMRKEAAAAANARASTPDSSPDSTTDREESSLEGEGSDTTLSPTPSPTTEAAEDVATSAGELSAPDIVDLGLPAPAPAPPEWFELHRIAVPLRTGEVLLLRHQPATPPPAEPAPDDPALVPPRGVPTEDSTVPNRSPSSR